MKSKSLLFAIMALGLALFSTSCDKDEPKDRVDVIAIEEDPSGLINNFVEQMEMYKKGTPLKNGLRMRVDSAIWYIDAALNYTYADACHAFAKLHRDTLYTEMPLLNGYEAAYEDVFEAYDTFLSGLSHHYYEDVEGDNKQFIMAMVDDMGPLPGSKQKLRIVTLTGTGTLTRTGDFGENESYFWNRDASYNCAYEQASGAPIIFEAMLLDHFTPQAPNNCRWYYYGTANEVTLNYSDYQLSSTLDNYLDYKIYAASTSIENGLTVEVRCLEFNQNNSGVHEMQFYYDHLKGFVNEWLVSSQNTDNKKLADVIIASLIKQSGSSTIIYHQPTMTYRKRGIVCSATIEIPHNL